MATIAENLQILVNNKADIKEAIENLVSSDITANMSQWANIINTYIQGTRVCFPMAFPFAFTSGYPEPDSIYDAKIQYLETTGSQCIDTGISATDVYGVDFCFAPVSASGGYASILSGKLDDFTIGQYLTRVGTVYMRYRNTQINTTTTCNVASSGYTNRLLIMNGEYTLNAYYNNTITSPVATDPAHIFIANNTALNRPSKIQFKYLKLYGSNNKLIFDGYPVRVGTKGYLFDKVSHTLLGDSASSGVDFVLGPDIN